MNTKEQRVQQLAALFAEAIKGIDSGEYDDAVLIPFKEDDRLVVVRKRDGEETVRVINEKLT